MQEDTFSRNIMYSENNSKKKIALTFDLELWYEGEWLKPYITPGIANKDVLHESIDPLLKVLKETHSKATFFVTDEVLKKYPDVIKKIASDGHEIGSHSIKHTRLSNISPEKFREKFTEHSILIEKICGKRPEGFRAPHFSLSKETSWLIDILKEEGYKYDSSIFPIKTPEYGLGNIPINHYKISSSDISKDDLSSNLLEIPVIILDLKLFRIPVAGGVYFRILPLLLFSHLLRLASKNTTIPSVYFHPHELCALTPRVKGPILKTLLKYWGISKSLQKFRKLALNHKFDSIKNILKD